MIHPFELREAFAPKVASILARFAGAWGDDCTDPEEIKNRKFMILSLVELLVDEALGGGCENQEIAREVYRTFRDAGYPVEPKEAVRIVVRRANEFYGNDKLIEDFEVRCNSAIGTPEFLLKDRLKTVGAWSNETAFLFGIYALDDLTGGVQPGELMALSGAQGSMKTSLLLSGVENALSRGMRVQFYSLDMTPGEIQERRVQRRLNCGQYLLRRIIRANDPSVDQAVADICAMDAGLFEVYGNDGDKDDLTVTEIVAHAKRTEPDVICVDYLTLLRRQRQSDLECVNEVMPKLKKLAQSCGIRMILLSQMGRTSKREQLSGVIGGHAKGGGIVEEMVHSEIELFKDAPDEDGVCPIIASITKNRRGPSGRSYRLEYEAQSMRFTGDAVRVERMNKTAQKKAFERSELIGSEGPIRDAYLARRGEQ